MRVMLVVNEFPPEKIAGTAMATQALAEQLSTQGHDVCVVVTTPCPKERQPQIVAHDYALIWLEACSLKGVGWLWRMWQTFKHAKHFCPDVIQGQAVSCGLIAGVVGRILTVPSLCYAQGYDVFQASWLQKKTEIYWGCKLPNQCLAVTQHLADTIQDIVDITPTLMPHAFVLPDYQPPRSTIRLQYHLPMTTKLVLNVARLEYFKGHDVLLKAWTQCIECYPESQLWIVGTGSCQQELIKMAKDLAIQQHVQFLGVQAREDVHRLMEAADLFVLPSRSEPFGIVLLEAMAHALPIVASAVDGIPEVVPEVGAVELVPVDDVDSLAKAIQRSLADNMRPSLKNHAHALEFEWVHQVKRFELIYEKLIR